MSDGDVAETWKTSINEGDGFDLNQSLTSVPDGVYELSAQAMYRASLSYGTSTNCVLYATVGETTFSTPIANFGDYTSKEDRTATGGIATQMKNNNAYLNIVPAVIVEGGNVTIGMKSVGELTYCTNGYWFVFKKSTFTFKDVTTTYHAKLVARATTMLATAPESTAKNTLSNALTTYATANFANVKALQAAINTFLETATVDNPLNVTDYITNPSFNDDSGNKKNWIQDLGYKQPTDIYQPTGWNMLYSSAKVNNVQYQTYKTQTDNAKDNNCYYVRQRWGDVYAKVGLHQLVKELPSGAYRLTVAVKGGSSVTDANILGMKAGSNSNTTTVDNFDKSNYKDYSVQVNKTNANEDIDISFAWDQKTGNEQLYYIDDFRLYYLGDPVKAKKAELEALQATITDEAYFTNEAYTNVVGTERSNLTTQKTATAASETVEAYQTVIDATQAAIDAFVAAKTNYDALVAEIAKAKALGIATATADGYAATSSSTAASALTSTQALKVVEYTFVTTNYSYGVDLGEWTTEGYTADNSGQHWDGKDSSKYKEQENSWGTPKKGYAADSWSIKFYQSIELPAGNYIFKVAGRKASGTHTTMSLDVTKTSDDSSLGSINDFPEGDTGLGINTSGATDYTTGEGHTYANSGYGRGWEWRYVKFTLLATTEVKIAVNADADATSQWISFCNYTLQTDNEANISLIAYNVALASAQTVIADETYVNVIGSERTDLQDAIDADASLDKSDKDKIDAAKTLLETKTTAFTSAKSNYDAYVAAKAVVYPTLAYAATAKRTALDNAQTAANATSASDADTKTAAIQTAARQYYESNAMAEGVDGAENKTSLIENPDFAGVTISGTTAGGWTFDQTGGTAQVTSSESFTDGSGNSSYSYFDYYNGGNNNQNIHQVISDLAPGKYLLTATARGHANFNGNLRLYVVGEGDTKVSCIGNSGGVFNHGWNDVSLYFVQLNEGDITIGMKTDAGKSQWWGVSRFRLVKLPTPDVTISETATVAPTAEDLANVTLTRTLSKDYWNTFSVPFDMDIPAGWTVKEFDSAVDNVINFKDATTIKAGEPYLVKPTADAENPTFDDVVVQNTEGNTKGEGDYKFAAQIYNKSLATDGTIVYLTTKNELKRLTSGGIKGLRAYFIIPAGAEARISFGNDDATGISSIDNSKLTKDDTIYDLQGRKVTATKKGIYVVNGKKVIK